MPRLYETLSADCRLELAVQSKSPAYLARTFATFAGQFYDREAFDQLARQVYGLYDRDQAEQFRTELDGKLYDRYHQPVAWDVARPRRRAA